MIEPTQRRVEQARGLIDTLREYVAAEAAVYKTSEARRALPAGSSRAKATTANARWSTACEHRDRVQLRLRDEYGVELDGGAR